MTGHSFWPGWTTRGVARRRRATVGEVVASAEHSSEEHGQTMGGEKQSGWRLPR
jgi:hypothetical protein